MSLLVLSFFKNREVGACKAAALRRPGIALKEDARLISKVHQQGSSHDSESHWMPKGLRRGGGGQKKEGYPFSPKEDTPKNFAKKISPTLDFIKLFTNRHLV